jgi:hypothetical protein
MLIGLQLAPFRQTAGFTSVDAYLSKERQTQMMRSTYITPRKSNECRTITCTLPPPLQKTPASVSFGESIRFPAAYYPGNHLTLLSASSNAGDCGLLLNICIRRASFPLYFLSSRSAFPPCLRISSFSQTVLRI